MGCLAKKKKKQVKSSKIGKGLTLHLHKQDMKGGKDEVEGKIEQLKKIVITENEDINSEENKAYIESKREAFTAKSEHPTYIIYDFEADVSYIDT